MRRIKKEQEHRSNTQQIQEQDFWNNLPVEVKAEIETGIKQLDNGERILFEEFLEKIPASKK